MEAPILRDRVYTAEQIDLAFDSLTPPFDYNSMTFNSTCDLFPERPVEDMSSL